MLLVACSGFPIPVSRYWREFPAVEIADTDLALPGAGTVRRWIREAPSGYAFSVVAPKVFGAQGFARTTELKSLAKEVAELGASLSALALVFAADDGFKNTKPNRAALKAFVDALPAKGPQVVLDLRAFKTAQIAELGTKRAVLPAYDPFTDEPPREGSIAYVRLEGPAGHRSRYDEAALDKLAEHCHEVAARADHVLVVFRNIDMHANATQLVKKLGL
jgi:uncharacterized protein YecE (DUF72 family)